MIGENGTLEAVPQLQAERSFFVKVSSWLAENILHSFWVSFLFGFNVLIYVVVYNKWNISMYNAWVPYARGAGMCLNFNSAISLLPMCRYVSRVMFDGSFNYSFLLSFFSLLELS